MFPSKGSKYGATKVSLDGFSFASKLEASVYAQLKLMEKVGQLKILQCQDHIFLTDARIEYIPDFKCLDLKTTDVYWVEAKGYESPTWPIKKRLWKHFGPGRLQIWKGTYLRPAIAEEIIPKRLA